MSIKIRMDGKYKLIRRLIFISLKDSNEVRTMYTKSDNVDIMTGVDTIGVVE